MTFPVLHFKSIHSSIHFTVESEFMGTFLYARTCDGWDTNTNEILSH